MKNKYGLPEKELDKIRARDKACVYCYKIMLYPFDSKKRNDSATIEHLNHLPPWNNSKTVAICCGECNSSRGKKALKKWFKEPYCFERNINSETVAKPVKEYFTIYEN